MASREGDERVRVRARVSVRRGSLRNRWAGKGEAYHPTSLAHRTSPTSPRPLLGRPTPVLRAYQVCRRARGLRTTWSRCGTPCSPSLRSRRWGWARATRSVSRRASSLDLAYISPRSSLDLPCSVTRRTSPTPTARPNPHLNPDPNPRPSLTLALNLTPTPILLNLTPTPILTPTPTLTPTLTLALNLTPTQSS